MWEEETETHKDLVGKSGHETGGETWTLVLVGCRWLFPMFAGRTQLNYKAFGQRFKMTSIALHRLKLLETAMRVAEDTPVCSPPYRSPQESSATNIAEIYSRVQRSLITSASVSQARFYDPNAVSSRSQNPHKSRTKKEDSGSSCHALGS